MGPLSFLQPGHGCQAQPAVPATAPRGTQRCRALLAAWGPAPHGTAFEGVHLVTTVAVYFI
jgi:hypothetical protein